MNTVRCKFVCQSVKKERAWQGADHDFHYEAEFNAVTAGSEENKKFFTATPYGVLKLGTILPDVFEPGSEYYVDISPAGDGN